MSTEPMFTAAMYGSAEAAREAEVKWLRAENEALAWLVSQKLIAHQLCDTGLWMIVNADLSPAIDGSEHPTALAAIDAARAAREG